MSSPVVRVLVKMGLSVASIQSQIAIIYSGNACAPMASLAERATSGQRASRIHVARETRASSTRLTRAYSNALVKLDGLANCAQLRMCALRMKRFLNIKCNTPLTSLKNPCMHNGTCSMSAETVKCDCTGSGFQGATCNQDIDECELITDICNGHGDCGNNIGGYTCTCDGKLNFLVI